MRLLGVFRGMRGRRPHDGFTAAWALCALLLIIPTHAPDAFARGTPAGTRIEAWAEATYEMSNGQSLTATSDTLVMIVAQVAGVDLEPPRSSVGDPGNTIVYNHTLANVGNGTDSFTVAASSRRGWPVRVHLDADGDGVLDAGDPEISGPISLAADDTAGLLVAVDVPGSASVRGATDTVDVQAASEFDGAVTDSLMDELQVRDVGIAVSLTKSVDRTSATIGDILTYTITYSASGPNTATDFRIVDPIPLRASYVAGTLTLNGASLTDASGDDAGRFEATNNRVVVEVGDITGGDSGTVTFQARVEG